MANDNNAHEDCPVCDGSGQILCTECIDGDIVDDDLQMVDCDVCGGAVCVPCTWRSGPL